jgi:hypothetical protein
MDTCELIPSSGQISGFDSWQPAGVYVWMAAGVDYQGVMLQRKETVIVIRGIHSILVIICTLMHQIDTVIRQNDAPVKRWQELLYFAWNYRFVFFTSFCLSLPVIDTDHPPFI